MKLALLTFSGLPQGDADDSHLVDAFKQLGVEIDWLIWDHIEHPLKHDLAVIRSVWDYHKKPKLFIEVMQRLNEYMVVLNSPSVVRWNSEKSYLKDLQDAGLPMAETQWIDEMPAVDSLTELLKICDTDVWFLKPAIGADASGTLRFKADADGIQKAMTHLQQHLSHSTMMLQPFLPSVSDEGELSVIYMGDQLTHAVIKKPKTGDYRVQDTFGGVDFPYQLSPAECALVDRCMAFLWHRFGVFTYARLDFLRNFSGQWVLNEVELIEPSLFFRHCPRAAQTFVDYILKQV
ncbi:MAG: hypothetical protein OQK49_00255 [Proteobacteria bacterium]|nr:hypothetical protein [Pseudomonadota bacterium]